MGVAKAVSQVTEILSTQWLANRLKPLLATPDENYVSVTAEDVKKS